MIKEAVSGGAGTLKSLKLRKEDCNVGKLKEATGVVDSRQWVRTLELSLDAHCDWKFADLVVQAICHGKAPITCTTFADMIAKVNGDKYARNGTSQKLQPADRAFD